MIRIIGCLLAALLCVAAYAENGCPRGYAWYKDKCVQIESSGYTVIPAPSQEQINNSPEVKIGRGIGAALGSILSSDRQKSAPVVSPSKDMFNASSGDIHKDDAEIVAVISTWSKEDCMKFIRGVWLVRRGWTLDEASAIVEEKTPGH